MKMWKWMGLIGVLAIAIWLTLPTIRIWRDPKLRSHVHSIHSLDPFRSLEITSSKSLGSARLSTDAIVMDHRVPFWDRYRSLLLGQNWSPSEGCEEWEAELGEIRLDGLSQEETIRSKQVAESILPMK